MSEDLLAQSRQLLEAARLWELATHRRLVKLTDALEQLIIEIERLRLQLPTDPL